MNNDFRDSDKNKEKITLGEEKFEPKPYEKEEIYDRDQVEEEREIIIPTEVVKDEPLEKRRKSGGKIKFFIAVGAVLVLLTLFAESLRTAIFKGQDSLIFLPKGGIFIPQMGVILITLGLLATGIAFVSLFNKEGKLSKKQKALTVLVGLIVAIIGVSTFFRYVDFRESTIVDKTILTTRAYPYLDVNDVEASTYADGEETKLKYTYGLQDGKRYQVMVTEKNMVEVREIDKKIKGTARRSIDNYAIQEMERLKMYTKDEALALFILE